MTLQEFLNLSEVPDFDPGPRLLHSATPEEVARGATTDIYFLRTYEILRRLGKLDTPVVAEIFTSRAGVMAGVTECRQLLTGRGVEVWALPEGEEFAQKEVVMRISGPYGAFGLLETPLLGILASNCAWASAARECRRAAGDKPVICFGARHVHPAVAPVMERAALVGGASGASCIMAARLAGRLPSGTIPHAAILIVGDTVEVARAYDRYMPPDAPRIILVDTFKDEAEESLRVARALGPALNGVRLDTPAERGGVTPELVQEVRQRLDQAGFRDVKIFVSGGLDPARIALLSQAGADAFGVGSYISGSRPIDMTMDLKEVAGQPVAKRGRIPGITPGTRLQKVL
ncbi:MAG: nicotinate phosphoribosyltransferase [Bacillota bacterium]|nr:nicotinate phosphoribosyltransferase [Bacillota bacterium]MDI7248742.1 nicotinate phosphoribosyltransferase [Bacillota bacterium]